MNTRQILERRAATVKQMCDMQDEADATSDGVMTAETAALFEAHKATLAALEDALSRRSLIEEGERRVAGQPVTDPRFAAFTAGIGFTDALAALLGENTRGAGMAREASAEIARRRGRNPQGIYLSMGARSRPERRAVITSGAQGTPPVGSALVPTIIDGASLIDALRANLALTELGATFLTDLRGNLVVPKVTQGTSVGWFAENAPIPETDMKFDPVGLSVKHVGAITEYSRNILLNSTPDIESLLRADLMRALAVEIDRAALLGTGDGIEPRGSWSRPA